MSTTIPLSDAIEILSPNLIREQKAFIEEQRELARFIGLSIGWHYPLDWAWIFKNLGTVRNKRILDAGAGRGVLQWFLVENGAEVISVDRESRACLPLHIRNRYSVQGLRTKDLISPLQMINLIADFPSRKEKMIGIARSVVGFTRRIKTGQAKGKIYIYNQDLKDLQDIPSQSIDAIISVSALEHNPPKDLPLVVNELERVLRTGGVMMVTLAAARDEDWFHGPSKGWCYTEHTLRKVFCLHPHAPSNYDRYDELFRAIKESAELRDNLANIYYRTDKLGMPRGKWDPQYIPVGVIKTKQD